MKKETKQYLSLEKQSEKIDSDRRSLLKAGALTCGAIALTGIPLTVYVVSPALKKATGKWFDLGSVEDLQQDNYTMLSYEFMVKDGWQVLPQRGFVWASVNTKGQVKVFSSTCTHLACNVIWQEEKRVFECPCHSGRFDADGNPIAGPPTRPLNVLEHKKEDDNLLVYLAF
jgi:Rieske Fe-S protein